MFGILEILNGDTMMGTIMLREEAKILAPIIGGFFIAKTGLKYIINKMKTKTSSSKKSVEN